MIRSTLSVLLGASFLASLAPAPASALSITESTDFSSDVSSPTLLALDLGLNTVSGTVPTLSGLQDLDFLQFTLPVGAGVLSQRLVAASFPSIADPSFLVNQCQFGSAGCGTADLVTPATPLPHEIGLTGTDPAFPINGLGVLASSGFGNCGTGCGYTIEILVGVPEPASLLLATLGLLAFAGWRRRAQGAPR